MLGTSCALGKSTNYSVCHHFLVIKWKKGLFWVSHPWGLAAFLEKRRRVSSYRRKYFYYNEYWLNICLEYVLNKINKKIFLTTEVVLRQIHLVVSSIQRMTFGSTLGCRVLVLMSQSMESISEQGNSLRKLAWKLHQRSNVGKGSKCLLSLQRICNIRLWNAFKR